MDRAQERYNRLQNRFDRLVKQTQALQLRAFDTSNRDEGTIGLLCDQLRRANPRRERPIVDAPRDRIRDNTIDGIIGGYRDGDDWVTIDDPPVFDSEGYEVNGDDWLPLNEAFG